jgi:putative ABC transport system ATP-binding protein
LPFDYATVRRGLAEGFRGVDAETCDVATISHRLQELAPSWRLRIDMLEASLRGAVALVRPTAPLALIKRTANGAIDWLLIADHHGKKVKVHSAETPEVARWISLRQLRRMIGDEGGGRYAWLALQPLLPCEPLHEDHGHAESPHWRYLQLLAPERSDIFVIVIFAVVVGLLALSTPIAVEALVNTVAFGQFIQPVVVLAVMLFVFLALAAAMRAVQTYVAEIIQRRIFVRITSDLAQRLPRVRRDFWNHHYGPELINRFFEVVTVQKITTQLLLDGLALLLQTLVGMTVIAFYHPVLLGFDVFLLLLIVGVVFVLGRGAVGTSIDESKQKYATAAWLEELARHPTVFRSHSGVSFAVDQANRRVTGYLLARQVHFRVLMRQIIATLALQVLASTVLLGLGGWLVITGELTLGQLVAAELIVTVIVGSFAKIGKYLEGYYDVMASVDKLGHLFDMPMQSHDGVELPRTSSGMAVTIEEFSIDDMVDASAPRRQSNFVVGAGEHVAVIGSTGRARSHLLDVISGVALSPGGHVEFDGYDLRRVSPESVYSQAALVRQPEIFAATIAENIHVGRGDVTEEDIRRALEATGLLDEFLDLSEGLSTPLDSEGHVLSHDQRVRLMFARAIAGAPRLLLIDGAIDLLPDELVDEVVRGAARALPSCTFIVSTGRSDVARLFQRRIQPAAPGLHSDAPVASEGLEQPSPLPRSVRQ